MWFCQHITYRYMYIQTVFKCRICFLELVRSRFCRWWWHAQYGLLWGFCDVLKDTSWLCCVNLLHTCILVNGLTWLLVPCVEYVSLLHDASCVECSRLQIPSVACPASCHHCLHWRHVEDIQGIKTSKMKKMAYLTSSLATVLPVTDVMYIVKHCFHLQCQFSASFLCNNSASVDEVVPSHLWHHVMLLSQFLVNE